MNLVKYVPADPRAREADRTAVLLLNPRRPAKRSRGGRLTMPQGDQAALRRGWVRLSSLPPAERAKYSKGHATKKE